MYVGDFFNKFIRPISNLSAALRWDGPEEKKWRTNYYARTTCDTNEMWATPNYPYTPSNQPRRITIYDEPPATPIHQQLRRLTNHSDMWPDAETSNLRETAHWRYEPRGHRRLYTRLPVAVSAIDRSRKASKKDLFGSSRPV